MTEEAVYRIEVQGTIGPRWEAWFEGLTLGVRDGGDGTPITTLTGAVADQSALRGILAKLWDLNLTLLSVIRIVS
jgi:hypothetical protein